MAPMQTATVNVATTQGRMPLYDVRPDGQAKGAIVVIQEAFGVNDHIEDVTRRFGAEGYRAVAPHLYYRTGDGVIAYGNFQEVMPHAGALTYNGLLDDLDASLGYLEDAGFVAKQIGVVGFCMGGTITLFAAARLPIGAGVSFYGGGVAEGRFGMPAGVDLARDLQAPWLGLYGDLDQSIPVVDVERLREVAAGASVPTEVVRYPDAGHGFHCDQRPDYHASAARDAWSRALAWFGKHLG